MINCALKSIGSSTRVQSTGHYMHECSQNRFFAIQESHDMSLACIRIWQIGFCVLGGGWDDDEKPRRELAEMRVGKQVGYNQCDRDPAEPSGA